jgi:hypothetical protein
MKRVERAEGLRDCQSVSTSSQPTTLSDFYDYLPNQSTQIDHDWLMHINVSTAY